MNTDSFIYKIETEDFYEDIKNDINDRFDTSEYPINNSYNIPLVNKKKSEFYESSSTPIETEFFPEFKQSSINPNLTASTKQNLDSVADVSKSGINPNLSSLIEQNLYYGVEDPGASLLTTTDQSTLDEGLDQLQQQLYLADRELPSTQKYISLLNHLVRLYSTSFSCKFFQVSKNSPQKQVMDKKLTKVEKSPRGSRKGKTR